LGHSAVATLDIGVTVFTLAGFFALWHWSARPRPVTALLFGLAFGLSVTSKFSGLFLLPLAPLLAALRWDWKQPGSWRLFLIGFALAAASGWLAILAAYQFKGFPLPTAMLEGIRLKSTDAATGELPSFLLGEWSKLGWKAYYPIAMALKFTVPFLALLLVSLAQSYRTRSLRADAWMILPLLLTLYVLTFQYTINYGIRYLLPGIPLLILFLGRGISLLSGSRLGCAALAVLAIWQLVTSATAIPHHLSYFNELAGDANRNRQQLLDSNLDWGQDLVLLKSYLEANQLSQVSLAYFGHVDPALYGIRFTFAPTDPTPGVHVISANYLAGYPYPVSYAGQELLGVDPQAWTWLNRFQPIAVVGRSLFVFRITPDDLR
jgi:4-amino-4-deoxy-L-arabinose transferase-like glycosyltransferase